MNLLLIKVFITVISLKFSLGQQNIIAERPHTDSTVLVGSNVTFVCIVNITGTHDAQPVKWSVTSARELNATLNCTETLATSQTTCNITLNSVDESMEGNYSCNGAVGGEPFNRGIRLRVVDPNTMKLRDSCTGQDIDKESGTMCIPSSSKNRLFNCTVYNITGDTLNITWTINGVNDNGTSTVTTGNGQGLSDMRSSLDVSRWADEYQDQVIKVTCHFSGYMNIEPLEVTAQVKFYYDISRSFLIGLISFHVASAILAVVVVIYIIFWCEDHHCKQLKLS